MFGHGADPAKGIEIVRTIRPAVPGRTDMMDLKRTHGSDTVVRPVEDRPPRPAPYPRMMTPPHAARNRIRGAARSLLISAKPAG